ncbi:MAG: hypothetical protein V3S60_04090 [Acidimicrobiia bacterium]
MISLLVAVLTAVTLTSPFGEASAVATDEGAFIEVTVTIEIDVLPAPDFVVVHVLKPDGQDTFSLGGVGGGFYQGSFLVAPFNRAIAFEAGWGATPSALSDITSLSALGVDGDLLRTTFPPGESRGRSNWGWLALATTALALAAFLLWMRLPRTSETIELTTVDESGEATLIDEVTHPFTTTGGG